MNNEKILKKYIKEYVEKELYNQRLRNQLFNNSVSVNKERILEELDENLESFILEDDDWSKFPIGMYYDKLFGEE